MGRTGRRTGHPKLRHASGCGRLRRKSPGALCGRAQFEIIGEALGQLAKLDAVLAGRITHLPQIVAFRNQLIHGYALVNHGIVWNVIQDALPTLLQEAEETLRSLGHA